FRKETRKQGTAANPDERITVTTSWNPLIRVEGTIADKWKMSFNLTRTGSESTVQTQTGSSINSRGSTSIATTVRRTFERRGKQGANKNIDFSSEIRYTRSGDENRSLSIGGRSTENKDDSFDVRNTATLRFTRTVSGTFGLNLGQQRDITAQRTTRSIGVSFQTGFNF
ncbi:MAG: hypothetical protein HKN21_00890, partial [Candidatus Eisenbacteria bacterium]|nr:hypothetical protein [Candidatus Eisenbacteria bacterium]